MTGPVEQCSGSVRYLERWQGCEGCVCACVCACVVRMGIAVYNVHVCEYKCE